MRSISLATALEKEKISSDVAFVVLMKVVVVDTSTNTDANTLRVARNPEAISWNGQSWSPAAFELELSTSATGLPEAVVRVQDQAKTLQAQLDSVSGAVGFRVTLYVVNTGADATDGVAEVEELFHVQSTSVQGDVIEWTLGASNPLNKAFPRRRQYADRCSWIYKSAQCGYSGGLASCDYTLQGPNGCAAHNNARNFGGFPGVRR